MTTTTGVLHTHNLSKMEVGKGFRHGTHRLISPTATVDKIMPYANVMGITRLGNITGLDDIGIPVAAAYRPNSRGMAVSQGKGLDLNAAKASALMEAVEGFHAERIRLPMFLESYKQLRQEHRVVTVERLPGVVGSRFDPEKPILWVEARELTSGEPVLIPYEIVHTNYTIPVPQGSGCFQASSNGLAAGNHYLEALSHGICEIVERDATALWRTYGSRERAARRLDLRTVADEECRGVLELYASKRVDVAVWEITTDIEISSFYCVIAPEQATSTDHLLIADGMGCHPARGIALLRALLEAAQSRLTVIAGVRDDLSRTTYNTTSERVRFEAETFLALVKESGRGRSFLDGPGLVAPTFNDDLQYEVGALQAVGFDEILVADLSCAPFDIPVVRIVIPGLEGAPFQPGYLPGKRVWQALENVQ